MKITRTPNGGDASRLGQDDDLRVRAGKPYRPLTHPQSEVLRLLQAKVWTGQWVWRNHSTTRRILDALVEKGLVHRIHRPRKPAEPSYQITQQGEQMLQRLEKRGTIFLEIPVPRDALAQCEGLDLMPARYERIPARAPYISYQPLRRNLRGETERRESVWSARIKPGTETDQAPVKEVGNYKTPGRALVGLLLYLNAAHDGPVAASGNASRA